MRTTPQAFRTPHTRANRAARLLWTFCWALLFRPTPWFMGAWRSWLLRLWGAKLGYARFDASVRIWAPWRLEAGDFVYVDARVNLYNIYGIRLDARVIVSQGSFLCSASHDHTDPCYPLIGKQITVEQDSWIAADAFIGPGVTVHEGAVVAARAVVVKDVPPWTVVGGNPARPIKQRVFADKPR